MSRILVVGYGRAGGAGNVLAMGPGRRARQFAMAISGAGHDTTLVWITPDRGNGSLQDLPVCAGMSDFHEMLAPADSLTGGEGKAFVESIGPDAIVGATVHASAFAARHLVGELPLWVDIFGDPMAEAQAKAVIDGNDLVVARYWETLMTTLTRGDRFSAVSEAHAHAVVGQLGIAGRLSRFTIGEELVSVIPCSAERLPQGDGIAPIEREIPAESIVLLYGGSFNTWCDLETLVAGVEGAMRENESLHFVATGGAVPGHDDQTYQRFLRRINRSRYRDRFHVFGWVDAATLAGLYRRAAIAVNVEKSIYERRLGGENRVADWMAHGLAVVTTGRSEMGRFMIDNDLVVGIPPADSEALALSILKLAVDRDALFELAKRGESYAARSLNDAATSEPLVAWCAEPRRTTDAQGARLRVALASEPRALAALLEQYVAELGSRELGYRSLRWVFRRLRAWVRNFRPSV